MTRNTGQLSPKSLSRFRPKEEEQAQQAQQQQQQQRSPRSDDSRSASQQLQEPSTPVYAPGPSFFHLTDVEAPASPNSYGREGSWWTQEQAPEAHANPIARLNLSYAVCTMAGRNGSFPKDNQDAWAVKEHIGKSQHVMFGVFDGHGPEGKTIANIISTALPKLVAAALPAMVRDDAYEYYLAACFQECNKMLGRIDNLDCTMSGSTAVTAVIAASRLVVSNLGDSRCVLGRVSAAGQLSAFEMTNDHTPALLAESTRVLASGGRVACYAYGDHPVGALRVWLPDKDVPGLSMTRCFGDTIAASVGVIDVPEVLVYDIQPEDKYLVLMSDGVHQHMTTFEILELVHCCATAGTMKPSKVAKRLVQEARKRWAAMEDSADDCTAIVVFLDPVLHSRGSGWGSGVRGQGGSTKGVAWSFKRLFGGK